jgi:hypothetical protein
MKAMIFAQVKQPFELKELAVVGLDNNLTAATKTLSPASTKS